MEPTNLEVRAGIISRLGFRTSADLLSFTAETQARRLPIRLPYTGMSVSGCRKGSPGLAQPQIKVSLNVWQLH